MAGQFDPITPPSGGLTASKTLRHSYYFELAGFGHTTLDYVAGTACSSSIVSSFLQDPNNPPNSKCTAALSPAFVAPSHLDAYMERWGYVTSTPTH